MTTPHSIHLARPISTAPRLSTAGRRRPTSGRCQRGPMTGPQRVRIESGKGWCVVHRSASRDSQVRPTAQRSGRCPIGVRRFKSCSLHFMTRPNGRVINVERAGLNPVSRSSRARARLTVSRRFKSCSLHFSAHATDEPQKPAFHSTFYQENIHEQ